MLMALHADVRWAVMMFLVPCDLGSLARCCKETRGVPKLLRIQSIQNALGKNVFDFLKLSFADWDTALQVWLSRNPPQQSPRDCSAAVDLMFWFINGNVTQMLHVLRDNWWMWKERTLDGMTLGSTSPRFYIHYNLDESIHRYGLIYPRQMLSLNARAAAASRHGAGALDHVHMRMFYEFNQDFEASVAAPYIYSKGTYPSRGRIRTYSKGAYRDAVRVVSFKELIALSKGKNAFHDYTIYQGITSLHRADHVYDYALKHDVLDQQ